jgi:polysaccharide biosynthesis protein PslG
VRIRTLLGALALTAGLSVAGGGWDEAPARAADPVVPRTFFGIVPQNTLTDADLSRMAQGGVGTLRAFMNWGAIDKTPADDNDWSSIDPVVASAARNGITVLPFVFGTPPWVVNDLEHRSCPQAKCGLYAPAGQAALAQWQRFLVEAVERYGPGGTFFATHPDLPEVPIVVWQLWNEQNSFSFYEPKVSVNSYATLVKTGTAAIHSVDPNAKILLGGMFGTPGGEEDAKTSAWNYLHKLYRVPGIEASFDGIAVHPYAARMVKVIEQVRLMRKEVVRAHDSAEMWITEVGWSSGTGGNPLERGKRGQAARLRDAMRYFIIHQASYNIQNVTWFAWRDLGGKPICDWCGNAGLFSASSLAPKPAWRALMAFTGGS